MSYVNEVCGTDFFLTETLQLPKGEVITARVEKVISGDTLVISDDLGEAKVRLAAIDAPESRQPFAKESRNHLRKLALGKSCKVESLGENETGIEVIANVEDQVKSLNMQMVLSGHAWYSHLGVKKSVALKKAQINAREQKRGLWAGENPIAPWQHARSRE